MSSYTKSTDFASKDSLLTGNPLKTVKGTEIDDEFNSIQTAVNSKADLNAPALVNPTATTQTASDDSTKVATTAFVKDVVTSGGYVTTAGIANDAITAAKLADTAVTADTYGDASNIPQITVDAQGRLTGVTEVAVQTVTQSAGESGSFTLPGGLIVEWGTTAQYSFSGGAYSQGSSRAVTESLTNDFTNIYHAQATTLTTSNIYAYVRAWDTSADTITVGMRCHQDVGTYYAKAMWIVIGD